MTREKLMDAVRAMPEDEFEIDVLIERILLLYKKDKEENGISKEEKTQQEQKPTG